MLRSHCRKSITYVQLHDNIDSHAHANRLGESIDCWPMQMYGFTQHLMNGFVRQMIRTLIVVTNVLLVV